MGPLMMKNNCYSLHTTLSHPLVCRLGDRILERFDNILRSEGYASFIENGNMVINLDRAERLLRPNASSYNETMDFSIGLSPTQMLMVELKLRVSVPSKIKAKALEDKIKYSKSLLGSDVAISKERVFIFKKEVAAQARNHISRLFRNKGNYRTLTVEEFVKEYVMA